MRSGRIWVDDINCDNTELAIIVECSHLYSGWGFENCDHYLDNSGFLVNKDMCRYFIDVPVRLVDGPYEYAGRVEVYYNGEWGTVCGDGWDLNNAQVICRQLGYGRASFTSYYGAGSGRMWLTNVNCIGSELAIEDCSHSGWGDVKSCSHLEGAGVRCSASNGN